MRLSVWPGLQQPLADVLAVAAHADRTGWDGVYVADHFMGDGGGFGAPTTPTLEATAVLALLAGTTENVRLGTLVLSATYRHPAVLANWAATVDQASGGRLVLGLGAGWQENEHEQYGIDLGSPGTRLARFDEACTVVNALLREPSASFVGRWFTLRDAICEPKPVQSPLPLLIGGKGDRMLGVVARHADEWNMWSTPDLLRARWEVLRRHCEAQGRDPGAITVSTQALVHVTDDLAAAERLVASVAPRPALAGTVERIAATVADWAELGVGELIVPDFALGRGTRRTDSLDALASALAPFRDG